MKKIDVLLNEYGESHQNPVNKTIHWICVPAIYFSIVAMFWSIPSAYMSAWLPGAYAIFLNWGTIALFATLIYYLRLSPLLAAGMLVFSLLCISLIFVLLELPWPLWQIALFIFVVAWIGQFYGHKVEGKKPSFLKDIQFLMVGPAWLMHFIYKKLNIEY